MSAEQFARVYGPLQAERKMHTRQRAQVRLFLEAVYWLGRSGAQWRFLPSCYGNGNSVYKRFARWDDLVCGRGCSPGWRMNPTSKVC